MDNRFDSIIQVVSKGKKFLVVSHVNPEGDAVGSLLGMALALRSMGKDVTAYLEDPVPALFSFLPGAETIVHALESSERFDGTISVDCGQRDRLGKGFVDLKNPGVVMNIDHHATNDSFGEMNVVQADACAAGELVYDFCRAADVEISKDIAVNLYVAILTDTGSFRYSCATPEAFRKAGELVGCGVDPWAISSRVYENSPAKKYKLLGLVLSTLELVGDEGAQIAVVDLTLDMMNKTGATKDLSDGFVNYARGIDGVEVGALFRENAPNDYKISLRSKGAVDVGSAATSFGGGGHRNAAGFSVKGPIEEVKARVLTAVMNEIAALKKS